MGRIIVFVLLFASQTQAFADQKSEALALEELFQKQSTAVFSSSDWHQEIDLTIDGCMFMLRNEQHLPLNAALGSSIETSYFDLRQINSKVDQIVAKPNKFTVHVSWVKRPPEFIKTMEIAKRYIKAGEKARQRLNAFGDPSTQALADMGEKLWKDELAGPDGDYLRRSYYSREAIDHTRDPRRVYAPLAGFSLHVRPEDHSELVKSVEQYAGAWCQP
ncbi:hypothetical protein AB4Z52_32480 [Rhizobium sp. 2YAF20]|uniref:hypothetical protein n=1 Tax=Rhizobium sp. 2YAF20 TaxID=3233027 RepID=UPI003F9CDA0B